LCFTQPAQQKHQPIIGEVQFPYFLPADPLDRFAGLPYPGLDWLFSVVTLREHVRQPDNRNPAPTQPLLQPMPLQMPINNPWQPQANHDSKQQRKIIQRFGSYFDLRVHPLSLSDNSRFHLIFQRKVCYELGYRPLAQPVWLLVSQPITTPGLT